MPRLDLGFATIGGTSKAKSRFLNNERSARNSPQNKFFNLSPRIENDRISEIDEFEGLEKIHFQTENTDENRLKTNRSSNNLIDK